jgi:NAD(P)-dependent dehydrogenase (short-subunit alcohol dehydrogenase family)
MNALVTGGVKGIGEALVRELVSLGYQVTVFDIEKKDDAPHVNYVQVDISRHDQVERACASLPKLDLLINNAAIQTVGNLYSFSPEDWEKTLAVNVNGTFYVTQCVLASLKPRTGQIVIMGSVHGHLPRLGKYAYDASKAALEMMTKEFAAGLAENGIRVNMVEIGATATPMNLSFQTDQDEVREAKAKVPLGIILQPEDVARAVVALTQESFRYMTGSILTYDGGRSLGVYPLQKNKETNTIPANTTEPIIYRHDVFIAYHGSNDISGSYRKAAELRDRLQASYSLDCYLFPVGQSRNFGQTPFESAVSRCVVFVANETLKLGGPGSLVSEDIKNELAAYPGEALFLYCTGGLSVQEAQMVDKRTYKHANFAERDYPSAPTAMKALGDAIIVAIASLK